MSYPAGNDNTRIENQSWVCSERWFGRPGQLVGTRRLSSSNQLRTTWSWVIGPMVGKTLSHYKVLEKIGQGGMGEVYRAEDTNLSRIALSRFPLACGEELGEG